MTALVRRARPDESEALSRLAIDTFVATFGHLYKEEDLSAFLKKNHAPEVYAKLLADPAYAIWAAEDGEGAAAYCVAGPCDLPVPDMPENSGELARLYLRERAKGTGLAQEMLDIALAWLKARYAHIYLSVYKDNIRAQRLYEKRGFVKIHDYFYMVGNHADPEWIMELRGEW
jgi:ribosomal protein S18 acetylase RimI-like enzyme